MTRARQTLPGRWLRRLWRREDGTASIEFVVMFPVVTTIFMASVEAGYYMTRSVMLERGFDIVMRDFKLGKLGSVDHDDLRDRICEATPMLLDCQSELKIWMAPVNTATWNMPGEPAYCGDGGDGTLEVKEKGNINTGSANEIMLVRTCAVQHPFFPTTGIALDLRADSVSGGYQIAATTFVVNEPR